MCDFTWNELSLTGSQSEENQTYMYKAKVKSDTDKNTYIGLAGNTFKERNTNHKSSFRNRNYFNRALSKHI